MAPSISLECLLDRHNQTSSNHRYHRLCFFLSSQVCFALTRLLALSPCLGLLMHEGLRLRRRRWWVMPFQKSCEKVDVLLDNHLVFWVHVVGFLQVWLCIVPNWNGMLYCFCRHTLHVRTCLCKVVSIFLKQQNQIALFLKSKISSDIVKFLIFSFFYQVLLKPCWTFITIAFSSSASHFTISKRSFCPGQFKR